MTDKRTVELFVLKNAAISAELKKALGEHNISSAKSEVELATDRLVDDYIGQISYEIRANAERMAEFYKIFYMLENDIRLLIADALETAAGINWWDEKVPQVVRENVKRIQDREAGEGLAPRSDRKIDYSTFGELGEIIKENWDIFAGIFPGVDKNRVLRVVNRLNLVRGPIAHCGVLTEDEIVRLKLTVRDWYKLMD